MSCTLAFNKPVDYIHNDYIGTHHISKIQNSKFNITYKIKY